MPITLCCLLRATPGNRSALHVYEDAVLELLHDHDAMLVQRAVSDHDETPDEVQLYEIRSQATLDGYLTDPRRPKAPIVRAIQYWSSPALAEAVSAALRSAAPRR